MPRGSDPSPEEVTHILQRLRDGDDGAGESLFPIVYGELRSLAGALFVGERPNHTLQPTALVHEAWLKLAGHVDSLNDRKHFFVVAAKAMRQVIADHARRKGARKRGTPHQQVTLDTNLADSGPGDYDLVDLHDSLSRLAQKSERVAQVAELRLFGGLTVEETAQTLGVAASTVDLDWAMAKAWLRRDLESESS